jgi:hypothetical protein
MEVIKTLFGRLASAFEEHAHHSPTDPIRHFPGVNDLNRQAWG